MGAVGIFEDISEQRRALLEVQEKEKLQSIVEITGAVCHEMNQPLMAITGYTELIRIMLPDNEQLNEKFTKLNYQIDRVKQIIEKLMGITRYETKDYLDGQIVDIDSASEKKIP